MTWFSTLNPKTHKDLSKWEAPCEDACKFLQQKYPEQLLALISSDKLDNKVLSFAAELANELGTAFSDGVRKVLIPLLSHSSPDVREGAVYGLTERHSNSVVRFKILEMSSKDDNEKIRNICSRIINNIGVVKAF